MKVLVDKVATILKEEFVNFVTLRVNLCLHQDFLGKKRDKN